MVSLWRRLCLRRAIRKARLQHSQVLIFASSELTVPKGSPFPHILKDSNFTPVGFIPLPHTLATAPHHVVSSNIIPHFRLFSLRFYAMSFLSIQTRRRRAARQFASLPRTFVLGWKWVGVGRPASCIIHVISDHHGRAVSMQQMMGIKQIGGRAFSKYAFFFFLFFLCMSHRLSS